MTTTTQSPSPTPSSDLQTEIREMWRTRPVRTHDDRKVAGVCGGLGRRYGVDPVLARVAFVVAAFCGGAGVFLYSLAWLLLRRAGDEVSTLQSLLGRGRATGSKGLTIGLLVVAFLSMPTFGSGDSAFVGAGILATVAMLAGWYGLYRRTPTPPAGWESVSAPTTAFAPGAPESPDLSTPPQDPPQWDPLGAAPFAWDLPDPGSAPAPAPRRPRSRLTPVTLGIALIATAVSVGLAQLAHVSWLTAPRIAAIALAVVGAGLLVGSALRRGHGLLVVAGPLAGFVVLSSLVPPIQDDGPWDRTGNQHVTITEPQDLDRPIVHGVGDVTVDLASLTLDHDRTMSVSNDVGDVEVTLPRDLDVRVECSSDVGTARCPSGLDTGSDGRSGPVLTLQVRSDVGDVRVDR